MGFDPAAAATTLLYSGEQFDSAINQQYLRARYYDAATGRFNRLDPFSGNIRDPQSLHKYAYTHGNPVNGTDPTGKWSLGGLAVAMSIGAALGALAFHATGIGPWWEGALWGSALGVLIYFGGASLLVNLIVNSIGFDTSKQIIQKIPAAQLQQDREYAQLAAAAYDKPDAPPVPANWMFIRDYDSLRHSGYYAQLYRNLNTGEFVLAYSGTNDWPNWKTNFSQGLGRGGIEYDIAIEDAQDAIDNEIPAGAQLRFVGHSLGGGMATAASVIFGRPATTFNAACVHANTVQQQGANLNMANQLVDAYRVQGELLSTIQDSNRSPFGYMMPDGNGTPYWLPSTSWDPVKRHFMEDVLAGFDKMM